MGGGEGENGSLHCAIDHQGHSIGLDQTARNFPVFCGHFVCWERIMFRTHYLTLSDTI